MTSSTSSQNIGKQDIDKQGLDKGEGIDDALARRNARVLALAMALSGANAAVTVATGGIIGSMLAPDKGLATLSITVMVFGMWFGSLPAGMLPKVIGRRAALQVGSVSGMVAGLISCWGVLHASFPAFLTGAFFSGVYAASHISYRFAATDTASDPFKPKAISWVLAGGVVAGVVGPQLVIFTKDAWPPFMFAATFIGQSLFALAAAIVLSFLRIPRLPHEAASRGARPLKQIAATPRFIVAVMCGVISYALMNMMMTSAPLAMVDCGLSVTDASLGIQWHILAMYAPSFVTGSLIARFGVERVTLCGFVILAASAATNLFGQSVWHFWSALMLLGLGWNLSFIGATAMVTTCHAASERNKVQALNDFLMFSSMALGSFMSGKLLDVVGWAAVNEMMLPFIAVAGAALLMWMAAGKRRAA